jgi:hypothetical protein
MHLVNCSIIFSSPFEYEALIIFPNNNVICNGYIFLIIQRIKYSLMCRYSVFVHPSQKKGGKNQKIKTRISGINSDDRTELGFFQPMATGFVAQGEYQGNVCKYLN